MDDRAIEAALANEAPKRLASLGGLESLHITPLR
jgi:hypothetical protein